MMRYIKSDSKPNARYQYTFKNGDVIYSDLSKDEFIKRWNRLDTLRVILEGYEEGPFLAIHKKAVKALSTTPFTGIIRLNSTEKDNLSYLLESDMLSNPDRATIKYYCGERPTAKRIGEDLYEYRGFNIHYNYENKRWYTIDPKTDEVMWETDSTLKAAKRAIDDYWSAK